MWRGLYVNKDGCYLHDTNKPTSKTENMSDNRKKKKTKTLSRQTQCGGQT